MSAVNQPVGYRIEYRAGDYCWYTLEDFQRETQRLGGRIHSLHREPVHGCNQKPVAFLGDYWCSTENRAANSRLDPDAKPIYLGPELHDPEAT